VAEDIDRVSLREVAAGLKQEPGRFTDDDAHRTPLPGLPPALPCPFCGSVEDIMISRDKSSTDESYRVQCGRCGVDAPGEATQLDAAKEWNKRPAERQAEWAAEERL
jgi:Lar family restriction alleviation protein